ncbi:MAG: peptidase [Pseudomonadota bacterium]|nr:peptidase [Pseudomonadota bacterium]
MTYCLAIRCDQGLVFASDSRTNAGVDQVTTYSKMHVFEFPGERIFVLLSAGNLATTQEVVLTLQRDLDEHNAENLRSFSHLADAAAYVGRISTRVKEAYTQGPNQGFSPGASFILGGQIGDSPPDIYLIYPEGNFITCSAPHPFLQVGESKYGKPILDRVISAKTSLEDAARCALVSIDSTMRSNATVGPPIELLLYQAGSLEAFRRLSFDLDTPYLSAIRDEWAGALRRAFDGLPRFDWE